jgi:hypothetical protein
MRNDDFEMHLETTHSRIKDLIARRGEVAMFAVKVAQALDALDLMTQCVARDKSPIEALMLSGIVTDALAEACHSKHGNTVAFIQVLEEATQILDDGKAAITASRKQEVKGTPIDQMVAEIMSKMRGAA